MTVPVVLLHGFAGTTDDFAVFVSALRRLGVAAPVRAISLPGHEGEPVPAGFEAAVDHVAVRLRRGESRPVHLVGYSLGGRVALGLLARHPDLAAQATLVGAHPGLGDPTERAARLADDERWARLLETGGVAAFLDAWEAQPIFATQRALPEAIRAGSRGRRLRLDGRSLAEAMRTLSLGRMPDFAPALPSIRCRVDLVAGALDAKFSALAHRMASTLPDGHVAIVPDAGHNVVLERPETLAAIVAGSGRRPHLEALA